MTKLKIPKEPQDITVFLEKIYNEFKDLETNDLNSTVIPYFNNLKRNFTQEKVVKCLFNLRQITEILKLENTLYWVKKELDGYYGSNKFFPKYRRCHAIYYFGDIATGLKDSRKIVAPISEIASKIDRHEDIIINLNNDDRLVIFHIHEINVSYQVIYYKQLEQTLFGIWEILVKILQFSNSIIQQKGIDLSSNEYNYINVEIPKDFKNHYGPIIYLINIVSSNKNLYNIYPFLLRKLFENLIYHIFQRALKKKYRYFYFNKNRPQSFSRLIKLFNNFKNKEFLEYHNGAIDEELTQFLILIRNKGNLAVHQLAWEITEDKIKKYENNINKLLKNLLFILEHIPKNQIDISDGKRLKEIEIILKS